MPALELPLRTAKKIVAHTVQSGGARSVLNSLFATHSEAWPWSRPDNGVGATIGHSLLPVSCPG